MRIYACSIIYQSVIGKKDVGRYQKNISKKLDINSGMNARKLSYKKTGRYLVFSIIVVLFSVTFASLSFAATITSSDGSVQLGNPIYPIPTESEDLKISVRIFDPDFNVSPNGIDEIARDVTGEPGVGPVKISIVRGEKVVLGYAGGSSSNNGKLDSKPLAQSPSEKAKIKQFGPIQEISPQSGIFEFDFTIKRIDGPQSSKCPLTTMAESRFDDTVGPSKHCILEGDVLLVEYTDPQDSSGSQRTVSVSSTFSLLSQQIPSGESSEKLKVEGVYRIGHPITLLLYDFNLNLDGEKAESYSLDLIEFESDKVKVTLGRKGGVQEAFDPKPSVLRETGENTGIFYSVIELPRTLKGQTIQVNEKIKFQYIQRGFGGSLVAIPGTLDSQQANFPSTPQSSPEKEEESSDRSEKTCKPGFVKMTKSSNGAKACVTPSTAEVLIKRGWGTLSD